MTIFSSGISMYALGLLLQLVLGWSFTTSVLRSAAIVLVYTFLGGLTSAIYNEVLQFFLIVLGFAPLAILAVMKAGGWAGIESRLPAGHDAHLAATWAAPARIPWAWKSSAWSPASASCSRFGYWCTNFLVVQRAMAADSMSAARRTPLHRRHPQNVPAVHRDPARHRGLALAKMTPGLRAARSRPAAVPITTRSSPP